uniref:FAN-like N-terminal PH domain-containing protein n=1 Tax=Amphimedon queenslandica TaxID=400682 RepID=A0A1X7SLX8_AMPQE
ISDNSFLLVTTQSTEMLERNIMAPFSFVKKERRLVFSLNYGNIDAVLAKIVTLERAVKLGKKDQNLLIENIVQSRQNEVSFNTSWLENLYEEIILETQ